ncbi:MAG: class I SAM-dependent methyltransferase [Alphaproteobacteria bacterium]|nr:class I SAM-dependent methyltransferase [Alphaproteobacteria bacterium]
MELPAYANRPQHEKAGWYSPAAEAYVRARPKYPSSLITAVSAVAGIGANTRLLEIGSGPGTATRAFAPSGASIVCVEPNVDFVAIARRDLANYPQMSFVVSSFEDAVVPGSFDVMLAATSFHWINPERGVARIKALLNEGGCVLLLWNKEPQPIPEQIETIKDAFRRAEFPLLAKPVSKVGAVDGLSRLADPLRQHGFKERILCYTETHLSYDVETFVCLHQSLSPYLALSRAEQERATKVLGQCLTDLPGGTIYTSHVSVGQVFQVN